MMTTLVAEPEVTVTNSKPALTNVQRIVLTGFMGAGKSTVGRILAQQLGWTFLDVDHAIEQSTGRVIAEIFATDGEAAFRRLETKAITRALGQSNVIIALGGGAPEMLGNRLLLEQTANTAVIFLDAPFETLYDRCILQQDAAIRPNLQDPAAAAKRFQQRAPHYRRTARHHIKTEAQTPAETAQQILASLGL